MLSGVLRKLVYALALLVAQGAGALAHDASAYGGVFRSRNLGDTWLNADVGVFLNAPLSVAIDPSDASHLLVGTDLGLLVSYNGGRDWTPEARDLIFGSVFAVTFSPDGQRAYCVAQSGVFRFEADRWATARAPDGVIPARALVTSPAKDHIYLLGRRQLFESKDGGMTYALLPIQQKQGEVTAIAITRSMPEIIVAVANGKVAISRDGGHQWSAGGLGGESEPVDSLALDPYRPKRIWAAQADRIYLSDDLGATWRSTGQLLPEPGTRVRGIAASEDSTTIVVTTQRGTYRSENGGESWTLKEGNLPIHLEAGPLARDLADPSVIYAVYSLMPYSEVWRMANEGGNPVVRLDPISLASGISFFLLILIGGGLTARRLARWRTARSTAGQ
jgi:photosystem II stability/assembly factor-like uncharacterized protein